MFGIDEARQNLKCKLLQNYFAKGFMKKWYKRWWGILIIVIVFFVIVFIVWFMSMTWKYYRLIQQGGLSAYENLSHFSSNQDKNQMDTVGRFDISLLITDDDPSLGTEDAALTIVEFADFQCPYSRESYSVVRQIASMYPDTVRFIYRDFPIDALHPLARQAAEAAECAHEQGKFWYMHDKIFQNQDQLSVTSFVRFAREIGLDEDQFKKCFESGKYQQEVEEDYMNGVELGVAGTPTFFFNGVKVAGSIPLDKFKEIIRLYLFAIEKIKR